MFYEYIFYDTSFSTENSQIGQKMLLYSNKEYKDIVKWLYLLIIPTYVFVDSEKMTNINAHKKYVNACYNHCYILFLLSIEMKL